jgi:transcriptional regulator of arginine metabolism
MCELTQRVPERIASRSFWQERIFGQHGDLRVQKHQKVGTEALTWPLVALIYIDPYNYSVSKLSRHASIRELLSEREIGSQDELRRALFRRGHRVTQATLSRDIHELGLVKTGEGYKLPQGEEAELSLPSIERLIQTFVYDVVTAQNLVVIKTSAGSAQPVSAAIDAEDWEEVVGTIGGDDTILAIAPDTKSAEKLAQRLRKLFA